MHLNLIEKVQKVCESYHENTYQRLAILLDDKVISAPQIREPITGGSGNISGNFSPETANDLAVLLRAGSLPLQLKF